MRIEAHYVIRSVRADLQLHNASDGDLSDLRSGPVIDSRLLSGRKTISGEWLSTDLRRWAPGNFYLEIHGEPPSSKGTVIYAKGAYWPYDDSAPWFKDYRMVVTDLQEPDGYTFEVVWSE